MLQDLAALKPWITALALPPFSLLVVLLLSFLLAWQSKRIGLKVLGKIVFSLAWLGLYFASCYGSAIWLEREFLLSGKPQSPQNFAQKDITALDPRSLKIIFAAEKIQAIVVLGGGVNSFNREYGQASLSESSVLRLQYGVFLRHQTSVPLAFSGGVSWLAGDRNISEAQAAEHWLAQLQLPALTWSEGQSRDTANNAKLLAQTLKPHKIHRIALVTHAMHMRRSIKAFEAAGFQVLPAPTQFSETESTQGLDWIPSGLGMHRVRQVLHEMVGLRVT